MVIDSKIEIVFTTKPQVSRWNHIHNTNYKVNDHILVHYSLLKTTKYRRLQLKCKCDKCQTEFTRRLSKLCLSNLHLCLKCQKTGSNNPNYGKEMPKYQKQLLSKMFSGAGNPFYGKTHSDKAKEKSRLANIGNHHHTGHHHSEKTKKLLSKIEKEQYASGQRTFSHGKQHMGFYKEIKFESTFEKRFLEYIDHLGYLDQIERGPATRYLALDKKYRTYLPDYYIKKLNLVIEIKSKRYWNLDLKNNIKKQNAAKRKYNYIVIIDNNFNEFNLLFNKLKQVYKL